MSNTPPYSSRPNIACHHQGTFTIDVLSFFLEMGEEDTCYGYWVFGAVGASGKTELAWEQYLEVTVESDILVTSTVNLGRFS